MILNDLLASDRLLTDYWRGQRLTSVVAKGLLPDKRVVEIPGADSSGLLLKLGRHLDLGLQRYSSRRVSLRGLIVAVGERLHDALSLHLSRPGSLALRILHCRSHRDPFDIVGLRYLVSRRLLVHHGDLVTFASDQIATIGKARRLRLVQLLQGAHVLDRLALGWQSTLALLEAGGWLTVIALRNLGRRVGERLRTFALIRRF